MLIEVVRDTLTDDSSTGKLYVNGELFCYTLEPTDRGLENHPDRKIKGKTAIPLGEYPIVFRHSPTFSPKFNFALKAEHNRDPMPYLDGIVNFKNVLIHWGNYPKDTNGCILVGKTRQKDFVGQSKEAFKALYEVLRKASDAGEHTTIVVKHDISKDERKLAA